MILAQVAQVSNSDFSSKQFKNPTGLIWSSFYISSNVSKKEELIGTWPFFLFVLLLCSASLLRLITSYLVLDTFKYKKFWLHQRKHAHGLIQNLGEGTAAQCCQKIWPKRWTAICCDQLGLERKRERDRSI